MEPVEIVTPIDSQDVVEVLQDLTVDQILKEMRSKYFVYVPINISKEQLQSAIDAFSKFLELPEDERKHIDLYMSDRVDCGELGYRRRSSVKDGANYDNKQFFHYNPVILEEYPEFIEKNDTVRDFMEKIDPIWQESISTLKHILSEMDKKFPGIYDKIFDKKHPRTMMRFLQYDWDGSGEVLARPHFDYSECTLAVGESCPGLRIGSCQEDLQFVDRKEGMALFMPSINLVKFLGDKEFKPAWHDVKQIKDTSDDTRFARWAVVMFVDFGYLDTLRKGSPDR